MNFQIKGIKLLKTQFSRAIQIYILVIFTIQNVGIAQNVEENNRPNLLFIMTDQQRFDAMSCAGNTVLETPKIVISSSALRKINRIAKTTTNKYISNNHTLLKLK